MKRLKASLLLLQLLPVLLWADRPGLGLHVHGLTDRKRALLEASGSTHVRVGLPWTRLEEEKGVFHFPETYRQHLKALRASGLVPVYLLHYGNAHYHREGLLPTTRESQEAFARYAAFVAVELEGLVDHFEVWNEWDFGYGSALRGRNSGSARSYVRLLKQTEQAIREVRPQAVVIGGACTKLAILGDWLSKACELGLLDHCDAFSFHPYHFGRGSQEDLPEFGADLILSEVIRQLGQYEGGRQMPLYITELGWPTHEPEGKVDGVQVLDGATELEQATWLARSALLALRHERVRCLLWYNMIDVGEDSGNQQHRFGLVRYDQEALKPGWAVFIELANWLEQTERIRLLAATPQWRHLLLEGEESSAHVFWALNEASSGERVLSLPDGFWLEKRLGEAQVRRHEVRGGRLQLTLSTMPTRLDRLEEVAGE